MKNTSNERVSTLLKNLSLSPVELARLMQKDPSTVYKIINGQTTPTKNTLRSICEATGANLMWLLTGKGEPMDPNPKPVNSSNSNDVSSIEKALQSLQELFKDQLQKKDDQINKLMGILDKVNFLNPLQVPDSTSTAHIIEFEPARDAA
jgi:transcriptional regulator with XRE-family HTH domain